MYKKIFLFLFVCLQVTNIWAAALIRSDVELTVTNDATYPWVDGTEYLQNGNAGVRNTVSSYIMSYTSAYKTEFSFEWMKNSSYHTTQCYIDGVLVFNATSSIYTFEKKFIEAGTHIIEFRDSMSISASSSTYSRIRYMQIKEVCPLETAVLAEGSMPITFTNHNRYPWTIEDGCIQSSNYGVAYSCSEFSATVNVTDTSVLSFERRVGMVLSDGTFSSSSSNYHNFSFFINGNTYESNSSATSYGTVHVVFEPGVYELLWRDTIYGSSAKLISQIRNIKISNEWLNIDLGTDAGSLGVEVLYQVNVLNDVKMLKVTGNINSTDWRIIRQMNNIVAIDLSEAVTSVVPDSAFYGLSYLSSAILPVSATSIGKCAFQGTNLWKINIPSNVTLINDKAFYQVTTLEAVSFSPNSRLQKIGYKSFYGCSHLREFIMPNSVTSLGAEWDGSCTFYGCSWLKKLYMSDGITSTGNYFCSVCSSLSDVHLPSNIKTIDWAAFSSCSSLRHIEFPSSLSSINSYAFEYCGLDSVSLPAKLSTLADAAFYRCYSLKYVVLPSSIENYNNTFDGCSSILEIVCPSVTPPSVSSDPFNAATKSAVTLKVPSVAVASYKLDNYWYQFGNIIEGDDVDYCKISGLLSLANNRRMNGIVDIDLYYGGQLTVGGNSPMPVGEMNYFVSEGNPARLLNNCPNMSIDTLTSIFSVSSGTWYFLTPLYDVELSKITHSTNASFVFRYYDGNSRATNGAGSSWRNVADGMLHKGQGYIFQCNADGYITLPSTPVGISDFLSFEDKSIPLSAYPAAASANKSWNYIGNPYPAYFDIYYIDFTAPITVWTGSTYKAYSITDDNYVLRPMQAFFVQKPDAIDNLTFRKEGRQHASTVNRVVSAPAMVASSARSRYLFDLQISNSEYQDETRVVLNDNSSLDYDVENDASKFMSLNADVPQIFTIGSDNTYYAINERPTADGRVYLGFYAGLDGEYTISALRSDADCWLVDHVQGDTILLSSSTYVFYSEGSNSINSTRFELIFDVQNVGNATSLDALSQSSFSAVGVHNGIIVNTPQSEFISVLSLDGILLSGSVVNGEQFITLPIGVYVVKSESSVQKVFVY